ncbi:hypothetical protein NECAME_12889 [Necator americanus]|uniref:NR LBD domain-containing protein n=1 Tax=Necator americanus TaxID=51031 RepID=W2SXT8_NECAM|nr:hypothetical protein NECAME_12889 [Necator americanus]ETN74579.1 hypothetical protein NECAME_12889 [Necator americanus]
MRKHKVDETEMIALYGVALFDPGVNELSSEARDKMLTARGLISKSLLQRYEDDDVDDPEIRLGTLYIDVYTYSKVHAITTSENKHLLDIFDIFPMCKERLRESKHQISASPL